MAGIRRVFPGQPPVTALRGVDLEVRAGDYVAIIGPSGSGKSTLMNVIGLLDTATSGSYLLDGVDVSSLSDIQRTGLRGHRIGFVFQDFQLLGHRTALENVAMGALYTGVPLWERMARAAEALTQVGLEHRMNALPQVMSGGERQRVAIARALVTHPSLLLCDEPTGNLDSAMAAQVMQVVDDLHDAGASVLVITHDPTTAAHASRQLIMRDGVLTEHEPAHG